MARIYITLYLYYKELHCGYFSQDNKIYHLFAAAPILTNVSLDSVNPESSNPNLSPSHFCFVSPDFPTIIFQKISENIKTADRKEPFITIQNADTSVQWEPTVNWGHILGQDKLAYLCSL